MQKKIGPEGLLALELELSKERDEALEELGCLRLTAGEQALEDLLEARPMEARPMGPALDITTRVNERVAQLDVMIASCRRRRVDAIKSVHSQRAEELREQATNLLHEAGRLRVAVSEVLDKLSALEDVTYDLSILGFQRIGPWSTVPGKSLAECELDEAWPDWNGTTGVRGCYAVPKHVALIREAARLEREAQIESGYEVRMGGEEVADCGSERTDSLDELLARLSTEPTRLWPTVREIKEWASTVRTAAIDRLGIKVAMGGRRTQLTLVWKDGEIDREASNFVLLRETQVHGVVNQHLVNTMVEREAEVHVGGNKP